MIGQLRFVLRGENQTSLTIDVESNTGKGTTTGEQR
jgi:hypothetical protein